MTPEQLEKLLKKLEKKIKCNACTLQLIEQTLSDNGLTTSTTTTTTIP